MSRLAALTRLAEDLAARRSLEALLQCIADRSAEILGAERVSVRLLNPSHTHLLAVARAGQPLHDRPEEFKVGEGLIGHVAQTGLPLRSDAPTLHGSYVARSSMSGSMGAFLGVPIKAGAAVTGVLSVVSAERKFTEEDEQLLVLVGALCGPWVEVARLARLARVDPLTGVLNRRGLDEGFPEIVSPPGPVSPLSVALADVDHLGRINAEHGHAIGDLVLKHVAGVLGGVVREGDAVVRYGGEEMLLVLPRVGRAKAAEVAERACAAIRLGPPKTPSGTLAVTISFGVAERRENERRDALIGRAEAALGRAKALGRNRVVLADA